MPVRPSALRALSARRPLASSALSTPATAASCPTISPAPTPSRARQQRRSYASSTLPARMATPVSPKVNSEGFKGTQGTWTRQQVQEVFDMPLMELIFRAATVHRLNHPPEQIQLCTLLNIKTGGCSEDCSYCAQSSKHADKVGLKAEKLTEVEPVLIEARKAKANGSTRFCMGAAWRDLSGRKRGFERILKMVKGVRELDMEVCATLGMLSPEQAAALKEAGLTAYNHNLDTSREYYPSVITTRTFDDRLDTIKHVREAGISVCSGGIIGLGEEEEDRVGLIWEMSQLPEPPESFPVNALVPIPGTPLEENTRVTIHSLLRCIATARIVLPTSIVRFAAGRISFTESEQALAFMAGANAIFTGERMLTTPTSGWDEDIEMMGRWGLKGMKSFDSTTVRAKEDEGRMRDTEARREVEARLPIEEQPRRV